MIQIRKEDNQKKQKEKKLKVYKVNTHKKTVIALWVLLAVSFLFAVYKNFTAIDIHTVHETKVIEEQILDTHKIENFVENFAEVYYSWEQSAASIDSRTNALKGYLTGELQALNVDTVRKDIPVSSALTDFQIWEITKEKEQHYQVTYTVEQRITEHQGYVLIQTDNYNIETSVTGLAIILILAMVVLFAIEWLLRRIFRTGAHTRGWFVGRKRRRARKQTEQALLKLAEGDYQQVEKLMAKNADHAEQPVVNYLLAAEAAQQRGDEARANQHLERAAELAGNDTIPVEITRVRLQLARNENHAARHGVDKLLEVTPRHPEVLRLAEQAYIRTGAWSSLLDIIPSMAKAMLVMKNIVQCWNNRHGLA